MLREVRRGDDVQQAVRLHGGAPQELASAQIERAHLGRLGRVVAVMPRAELRDAKVRDPVNHGQALHERAVLVRPEHLQRTSPRVGSHRGVRWREQTQLSLARV